MAKVNDSVLQGIITSLYIKYSPNPPTYTEIVRQALIIKKDNQKVLSEVGKSTAYMLGYGGSETTIAKVCLKAKEKRSLATPPHGGNEMGLAFRATTQDKFFIRETTMNNFEVPNNSTPIMTIERPVIVDNTNILKAKDFELQHLIRKAQNQIKDFEDLAKVAKKIAAQNMDLQVIIDLCVEQLDKGIGE